MSRTIQQTYAYLSHRKRAVTFGIIAFLFLCLWGFLSTPIRADIRTMLPEGHDGRLAQDFDMLAQSSLANNVFITVRSEESVPQKILFETADTLAARLSPPHFRIIDPDSVNPAKAVEYLLTNARNLVSEDDIVHLADKTAPDSIRTSLAADLRQLMSPQGIATKRFIQIDPLNFRSVLAPRLSQLNAFSTATVQNGHLMSDDGHALLIMVRSDIPMTDADGSAHLLQLFERAQKDLPAGLTATIISGHVHTVANATTIQQDLITISLIALLALGVLFVLFFRTIQALGVFLMPLAAMACGLGALALFNQTISAIVIGFGAVLIGISIDFAMHVYFALARHHGSPGEAASAVSRPILFCGLTSCAAFGALFYSGIPGIRQLALFSIAGLGASILFSLFILPLMSQEAKLPRTARTWIPTTTVPAKYSMLAWALFLAVSLWFGTSTSINPDLRNIGYQPESLRQTEKEFASTWGDMRNRAVIFAQGATQEDALQKNDAVYRQAKAVLSDTDIASLAPLLPSQASQTTSNEHWDAFWSRDSVEILNSELREEAGKLGFSSKAFTSFEKLLTATPQAITPATLDEGSLGLIRNMFMPTTAMGSTLTTYLPDTNAVRTFFSQEKEEELGVRLVSNTRFKNELESTMSHDIKSFIAISGGSVFILCFILFRNVRRSCLALMPAVTGLAAVFGVLGLTQTDLNLFHITALPLVIGLGADYGIFMTNRETQLSDLSTMTAVTASGLTTLAGFGVLALARHPSLHSMGITVLTGIGAALLCALFVLPGLLRREP